VTTDIIFILLIKRDMYIVAPEWRYISPHKGCLSL